MAIQQVSRRRPRATDFRVVQGALNADGMGNLLSGLGGTLPNTTYSSSIALAEVTGISARRVGVIIGVIFVIVAFFPKFTALLVGIPAPVAAAYITVLIALLFVQGMKIVIQDGIDHRKAAVAGVSFWLGTGFQNGWIFPDLLGDGFLSVLLGNGMTSGAMVAVGMTAFLELTGPRRKRLRAVLDMETLPKLMEFLRGFASNAKWDDASTKRLVLVGGGDLDQPNRRGRGRTGQGRTSEAGGERPGGGGRGRAGVPVSGRGGEPGGPPGVHGQQSRDNGQPGDPPSGCCVTTRRR